MLRRVIAEHAREVRNVLTEKLERRKRENAARDSPDSSSPEVSPPMHASRNRARMALACQFRTTSDSGSDTGSERSRIESMKL